jgi:DNA-binding Lrp family transcriptional regulator
MADGFDKVDRKIFGQLLLDSRQPLGRLAAKARVSKQNAFYRIGRMVEGKYINAFIALIDSGKIGYTKSYFYFKLKPLSEYQEKRIISELLRLGVAALFRCEGEWNLIVGIATASLSELGDKSLKTAYILRGLVLGAMWGVGLRSATLIPADFLPGDEPLKHMCILGEQRDTEKIDAKDGKLLVAVSGNARASYAELAKITGMPPETVRYRLKSLEKRKIIMGYSIGLGAELPGGYPYRVLVSFSAPIESNIKKVENYILGLRQARRTLRQVCEFELIYDLRAKNAAEAREITAEVGRKFHKVINAQVSLRILQDYHFTHFPPLMDGKLPRARTQNRTKTSI